MRVPPGSINVPLNPTCLCTSQIPFAPAARNAVADTGIDELLRTRTLYSSRFASRLSTAREAVRLTILGATKPDGLAVTSLTCATFNP